MLLFFRLIDKNEFNLKKIKKKKEKNKPAWPFKLSSNKSIKSWSEIAILTSDVLDPWVIEPAPFFKSKVQVSTFPSLFVISNTKIASTCLI